MKAKNVKVGEFYQYTKPSHHENVVTPVRVRVSARHTEPKSNITTFEVWKENATDPERVSAKTLSPVV